MACFCSLFSILQNRNITFYMEFLRFWRWHDAGSSMGMTKFTVRCHTNGTSVTIPAPGHTAEKALQNVRRNRFVRTAGTLIVFERKTGGMVLAVAGPRRALPVM